MGLYTPRRYPQLDEGISAERGGLESHSDKRGYAGGSLRFW